MGSQEVTFKSRMKTNELIDYLESIVSSLKQRSVCIQQGDEYTMLEPSDLIDVSVEASNQNVQQQLSISLSWDNSSARHPKHLKVYTRKPTYIPLSKQLGIQTGELKEAAEA